MSTVHGQCAGQRVTGGLEGLREVMGETREGLQGASRAGQHIPSQGLSHRHTQPQTHSPVPGDDLTDR